MANNSMQHKLHNLRALCDAKQTVDVFGEDRFMIVDFNRSNNLILGYDDAVLFFLKRNF